MADRVGGVGICFLYHGMSTVTQHAVSAGNTLVLTGDVRLVMLILYGWLLIAVNTPGQTSFSLSSLQRAT